MKQAFIAMGIDGGEDGGGSVVCGDDIVEVEKDQRQRRLPGGDGGKETGEHLPLGSPRLTLRELTL